MPLNMQSTKGHHRTYLLSPRYRKASFWIFSAASFIIFCVSLLAFHGSFPVTHDSPLGFPYFSASAKSRTPEGNIYDVYNDTLGFERIFLVSLPERSDRRDSFAVQARLFNMSFTTVDGVDGRTVSDKALPYTMDLRPAQIGAWRAHLNIMQKIVANDIATALIFEDDADWDVGIRAQMRELAKGTRWLGNATGTGADVNSPYGDGWDIIWIGHCSIKSSKYDPRRWVIPHDPTVVPPEERTEYDKAHMRQWETGLNADNQTRIIFVPTWGYCLAAYAVSLRGAMKILYHESMSRFNNPIDMGLGWMCADPQSWSDFRCMAPYPTIVGVSRPAGNTDKFSDIDPEKFEEIQSSENSHSEHLVFPVRQNVDRLLAGQLDFRSQFPDSTGETMHIDDIMAATGHGEMIDLSAEEDL